MNQISNRAAPLPADCMDPAAPATLRPPISPEPGPVAASTRGARAHEATLDRLELDRRSGLPSTGPGGCRFDPADLTAVMRRYAVGDVDALLVAALHLDDGDRILALAELERAARRLTSSAAAGYRYSPAVLADLLQGGGVASQTALLAAARLVDDGDRHLSQQELTAAAALARDTLAPNDLAALGQRVTQLGQRPGVSCRELLRVADQPIHALHLPCTGPRPGLRVLITAGQHGREPCGPAAALLFVEQLLATAGLRDRLDVTVVPLLNPSGYAAGTRRSASAPDLNRTFLPGPAGSAEAHAMAGLLDQGAFDLVLDLHSGNPCRDGFWALHDGGEELLAIAIERFGRRWPLLRRRGEPYQLGRPGLATSRHAGTLKGFAREHGARWSLTLEAPGSVSYLDQVFGLNELAGLIIARALTMAPS